MGANDRRDSWCLTGTFLQALQGGLLDLRHSDLYISFLQAKAAGPGEMLSVASNFILLAVKDKCLSHLYGETYRTAANGST